MKSNIYNTFVGTATTGWSLTFLTGRALPPGFPCKETSRTPFQKFLKILARKWSWRGPSQLIKKNAASRNRTPLIPTGAYDFTTTLHHTMKWGKVSVYFVLVMYLQDKNNVFHSNHIRGSPTPKEMGQDFVLATISSQQVLSNKLERKGGVEVHVHMIG